MGATVEVSGDKLRQILIIRAGHHVRRADWFRVEVAQVEGGDPADSPVEAFSMDTLLATIEEHSDKAMLFTELVRNVDTTAKYQLSEENYMRLAAVEIWIDPEQAVEYADNTAPKGVRYVYGYSMRSAIASALREMPQYHQALGETSNPDYFGEDQITAVIERVEAYLKGK